MRRRDKFLIAIAILAIAYYFATWAGLFNPYQRTNHSASESDTVYQVHEVVQVDTVEVFVTQLDTLYYPQYRTKYVDRVDTVEVEVLVYQDTVALDPNFSVIYNAHVVGEIRSINFGLLGKYPEITKTNTVKETITNTVYPTGWFVGVYATPHVFGLNLTKVTDRHSFSLGYGVDRSMYLGYSYRIK